MRWPPQWLRSKPKKTARTPNPSRALRRRRRPGPRPRRPEAAVAVAGARAAAAGVPVAAAGVPVAAAVRVSRKRIRGREPRRTHLGPSCPTTAAATTTPANSVLPAPAPTPMRRPVDSARTAPAPTRTHLPVVVARQMAALLAGDIVGGAVGAGAGWSYNTGSCPKSCLWYACIFVPPIHQREKLKRTCCLQIRAAGPPQSVIDRVLDAHDPRIAAVRTLQRYQRSGRWERVPAEHEPKPAGSESEPTAARSTESERGARRRGSRSSFTSSASSQTGSDSEPVTRSSFTESETESESETSVSTDSEDGAVHPAVQEAADSMWLKMKLDGGQRARTPSQMFAAARRVLAMPD